MNYGLALFGSVHDINSNGARARDLRDLASHPNGFCEGGEARQDAVRGARRGCAPGRRWRGGWCGWKWGALKWCRWKWVDEAVKWRAGEGTRM